MRRTSMSTSVTGPCSARGRGTTMRGWRCLLTLARSRSAVQPAPPADAVDQRRGQPHLTWVFVSPWVAGHGLGTCLLNRAAQALWKLGYTELLSTFLLGNDSSMLWHWRNGFELLAYPGSVRSMHE